MADLILELLSEMNATTIFSNNTDNTNGTFQMDPRLCIVYSSMPYYILLAIETLILLSTFVLTLVYLKSFRRNYVCFVCISSAEILVTQFLNGFACGTAPNTDLNHIIRVTVPYMYTFNLLLLMICFYLQEKADKNGLLCCGCCSIFGFILVFAISHFVSISFCSPSSEIGVAFFPVVLFVTVPSLTIARMQSPPWYSPQSDFTEVQNELYRRRRALETFVRIIHVILMFLSPSGFPFLFEIIIVGFFPILELLRIAVPAMHIALFFYYVRLYTFAKVPSCCLTIANRSDRSNRISGFKPDLCAETHPGAIYLNDLRKPKKTDNDASVNKVSVNARN